MQKLILLIFTFFISPCFPQSSTESDSIKWAFDKIEQGRKNYTDSSFAMPCFREALRIGKKTNNHLLMEKAFTQIGYQNFMVDSRTKTLNYYRKAIEQSKLHSIKTNGFLMFSQIARIHYLNDDYSMALDSLAIAEKYARKYQDNRQLLSVYSLRTIIFSYINQLDLTDKILQEAIKLSLREKHTPYLAEFYERTADLAKKREQYKQAITYYKKAIEIRNIYMPLYYKADNSYAFNKIGDINYIMNDLSEAKRYYFLTLKNAIDYSSINRISMAYIDLCKVEAKLGHFDKAFSYLAKLDSLGKTKDISTLIRRFKETGNLYAKLNKPDSALYYFKKALNVTERRKKKTNIGRFRVGFNSRDFYLNLRIGSIYKALYNDIGNIACLDSLFKYSNNYRSRSLFENNKNVPVTKLNAYKSAVSEVDKFYRGIRSLKHTGNLRATEELDQLKYNLVSKRIETLKEKAVDYKKISREAFQKYLAENNSCAVIYTINKNDHYALYLDKINFKLIDLNISVDSLQNDIKLLLSSAFYNKDMNNLNYKSGLAHQLYLSLWKPLEEEITILKNVIIIPDQNILNLPFCILLNEETEKQEYSVHDKPTYIKNLLVQKYNFSYLPSANLIRAFKPANENINISLVANPKFKDEHKITPQMINRTGWAFEPLLYSFAEVQSISKLFNNTRIYNGENAVKSQFWDHLPSSKIIHFATHAFVDTVYDLFSGLILSMPKDSIDDGFLLGYEIDQLDLNCDLITLSACESGRGKIISAEGVMGLPRLFFGAGAKSVLMTLWKIDDMQSATMMRLFYENIAERQLSKMEALGEAKRQFLNNDYNQNGIYFSYPFFWAAFNLYGDGGDIDFPDDKFNKYLYYFAFFFILSGILVFMIYRKRKF